MPLKGTQTPRVSIQSLITLGKKFYRISRTLIITQTWFLARLFVYLSSFISQILEFLFWLFALLFLMARQWKHRFQKLKETNIHLKNHHQIIKSRQTCSGVFLPAGVACRSLQALYFLSSFRGAKASAKRARSARHGRRRMARDAFFSAPYAVARLWSFSLASRLPSRAWETPEKKKRVCWGPVSPRATNSVNT